MAVAATARKEPARKRLSPQARAEHILDVALGLFSHQDFASVTTRDIAKACKVDVALIYYYFKNKDRLFQAVIEHAIELALTRYRQRVPNTLDPRAALSEWFRVNYELFTPLKNMAQILVAYNNSGPRNAAIDGLIRKLYRNEHEILSACIAQGVADGCFRALDPSQAATFISTHLDGMCFVSMTRPGTNMRKFMNAALVEIWQYLGASPSTPTLDQQAGA